MRTLGGEGAEPRKAWQATARARRAGAGLGKPRVLQCLVGSLDTERRVRVRLWDVREEGEAVAGEGVLPRRVHAGCVTV
jgi:hypothetical protein